MILLSFNNSNKAEIDQIPTKLIEDGADVLIVSLKNMKNVSIKVPTFPWDCKVAKLIPIFKKCSRADLKTTGLFCFCHCYLKKNW